MGLSPAGRTFRERFQGIFTRKVEMCAFVVQASQY